MSTYNFTSCHIDVNVTLTLYSLKKLMFMSYLKQNVYIFLVSTSLRMLYKTAQLQANCQVNGHIMLLYVLQCNMFIKFYDCIRVVVMTVCNYFYIIKSCWCLPWISSVDECGPVYQGCITVFLINLFIIGFTSEYFCKTVFCCSYEAR